jgi:hypothetical protein
MRDIIAPCASRRLPALADCPILACARVEDFDLDRPVWLQIALRACDTSLSQ